MQFKPVKASRAPMVAMTSMMDVIFLMLCFFITATVYSQWESEISIKLPNAKTAEEPDRLPGEIIVNLTDLGRVRVNGAEMGLTELRDRLAKVARYYPGQPVIIRGDCAVKYERLVEVIDTCRDAGVWNFSLATSGTGTSETR